MILRARQRCRVQLEMFKALTVYTLTSTMLQFRIIVIAVCISAISCQSMAIKSDSSPAELVQSTAESKPPLLQPGLPGESTRIIGVSEDVHAHHGQGAMLMPGMLTSEQMTGLAAATGPDFDKLFLEYMIMHHQGAVIMVETLFASPGAGQESQIFHFASDVVADQSMEITRMRRMRGMIESR